MSVPAIAVTGGIASGKSALCDAFARLGRQVIDADVAAREVVAPGTAGLAAVFSAFGEALRRDDGSLDRAALRQRIFADPAARRQLEALLHPLIRQRLETQAAAADGPYVLVAIPLLAESRNDYRWLSRIVVVDVPEAVQIARVQQRDGVDPTQARQTLAAQASRQDRLRIASDVVINDADLGRLARIAERLDRRWQAMLS